MKTVYHTLVIGTGCAGYHAAERLWMLGVRDIAIITEGRTMGTSRNTGSDKQTYYKLSLAGGDGDSVREMAQTLYKGGGVMGETALIEAAYSTRCFMHLVELGVPFPTNEYGEYVGYKTDHDPRSRATSSGPLTSKFMTEALEKSVLDKGIPILDGYLAIQILTENQQIRGLVVLDTDTHEILTLSCHNIILCTGGAPCVYENTVYPESQHGALGLAIEAGALMANLDQWQYGIASTEFRWNLSGSYQQVLPRYISVDENGTEREFLYEALGEASLGLIFLKGYQWPFDVRKIDGSSKIDLLVANEITQGRRVFLDFTSNPLGWDVHTFSTLSPEAYRYLQNSDCLFGTPIRRLEKLNQKAIELYASHGIDLSKERLEIAVCAQHINGGVAVDENWESSVKGLYAAGEAAGTFGVYRPGGSALNATQVGSLRAAEHIAGLALQTPEPVSYNSPTWLSEGTLSPEAVSAEVRRAMSLYASFHRNTREMKKILDIVQRYLSHLKDISSSDLPAWYRLRDQLITTRAVLSAMLCSAGEIGSHGSALIQDQGTAAFDGIRRTRTVTSLEGSYIQAVTPIPDGELWFETVFAGQKNNF